MVDLAPEGAVMMESSPGEITPHRARNPAARLEDYQGSE